MFYDFAITVPANTAEASPVNEDLKLAHGIIHRIEVEFPVGCRKSTHCRLLHHSFGHLPTNPQGSFATDGYVIVITSPIEFYTRPYTIKAICWNLATDYPHTVTLRFDIVESKWALLLMNLLKRLDKLLSFMGIRV